MGSAAVEEEEVLAVVVEEEVVEADAVRAKRSAFVPGADVIRVAVLLRQR